MDYALIENELTNTVEDVSKAAGWTVDRKIVLAIASKFVASGKTFDAIRYKNVLQEMKKQSSWMSPLRTTVGYSIAANLLEQEDTEKAVQNLLTNVSILKEAKFRSGNFSYIGAQFLTEDEQNKKAHAQAARTLFDAIRKHHPFLTSYEDIPYAVLLSSPSDDVELRAETMNQYYKELRTYNFNAGNELQWLSQVLTFLSPQFDVNLAPNVVALRDTLKNQNVKVKAMHYPLLGFLAILSLTKAQLQDIIDLYHELKDLKLLKWHREFVLFMAVQIAIYDMAKVQKSLSMTIMSSIELLIQAQQAAMIAAVSAAAIASSSSSS
ncbi:MULTISPECIES: DUF4003 family protein [unclassified Lysinibacillus]|uniref:DUF4003 family protein n=1 Tax=unclassified Lysinibacillus TaxID=2636778 RepID=UPI000881347E|nr:MULTISPECIES: DUF4003 family protein [unclassified Lysinibacillus]SCY70029.1 Protein of unknown function [Lysinibacillus sp. SG9]SDB31290.1 Protein of unknown function [Lysinibacillus sp. TC-37]SFS93605.1 Protein of unknown function [Lysinibacillus sp. SG55]